ncbi:8656_t:CDS:2 [Funneliformis mosseae]|uniref:8656_t:CDS:1 n=1 Tax=Funneliformis mosseae TaxID=27381 RepID=A0A9N9DS56_FUNMO|nr:8656_t:CDS:2 [Funneliformis mosseae]
MNKHLHQRPLIPDISQQNLTADTIRKQATSEMYTFCKENLLVQVWSYMWREWYTKDRWALESPQKKLLYKFFHPRLDLLMGKKAIKSEWKKLAQKQSDINNFNKYYTNIENWICGCPYYLTNRFMLYKTLIYELNIHIDTVNREDDIRETNNVNNDETNNTDKFENLIDIT